MKIFVHIGLCLLILYLAGSRDLSSAIVIALLAIFTELFLLRISKK